MAIWGKSIWISSRSSLVIGGINSIRTYLPEVPDYFLANKVFETGAVQ